ncbi:zinc-dependent peptidase [Thiomicrorhabdus aquaedulcis]|uniref:M90 family metallopeptidase n=1 Tax=Thiomicrorhabdus aquaedulcis TaxID=2211106 RepID=UPI000FD73CC6|nr:M90 family metallopeptidase [Thiomicrorhabdus aquaedulcis]
MIFNWLKDWQTQRILKRYPISHAFWHQLMTDHRIFDHLTPLQKVQLRELTILFTHQKNFSASNDFSLSRPMTLTISAYACLLILELGLEYYQGWHDIVVYPSAFFVERDEIDQWGVVSHQQEVLEGEAWLNGPVVLDWQSFKAESDQIKPGHNLVLHEFSHKLDMLNGRANGMPPLHNKMTREPWTQAFSQAFERLQHQVEHGHHAVINSYAATDPAEFFAVCTEYFFTAPNLLIHHFPAVYQQLVLFYQQDPNAQRI